MGLVILIRDYDFEPFVVLKETDSVFTDNAIWGGFSFLFGFLVVFRTQQAYNRFWEGCTAMHQMGAEWFDACSSLIAFSRHSNCEKYLVLNFRNKLLRLFSLLHGAAMAEVQDSCEGPDGDASLSDAKYLFKQNLIDIESLDQTSLIAVCECDCKVELIFQWVQQLIVDGVKDGILTIPAPILSRSFQEIATGMVHFHEALKISTVPFPFPV